MIERPTNSESSVTHGSIRPERRGRHAEPIGIRLISRGDVYRKLRTDARRARLIIDEWKAAGLRSNGLHGRLERFALADIDARIEAMLQSA